MCLKDIGLQEYSYLREAGRTPQPAQGQINVEGATCNTGCRFSRTSLRHYTCSRYVAKQTARSKPILPLLEGCDGSILSSQELTPLFGRVFEGLPGCCSLLARQAALQAMSWLMRLPSLPVSTQRRTSKLPGPVGRARSPSMSLPNGHGCYPTSRRFACAWCI